MSDSIVAANQAQADLKNEVLYALRKMRTQGPGALTEKGKSCRKRILDFAPAVFPTAKVLVELLSCGDPDVITSICTSWARYLPRLVTPGRDADSPIASLLTTSSADTLAAAEAIGQDLKSIKNKCLSHALYTGDAATVSFLHKRFEQHLISSASYLIICIEKCHQNCADALSAWIGEYAQALDLDSKFDVLVGDFDALNTDDTVLKVLSIFAWISPEKLSERQFYGMASVRCGQIMEKTKSNHGRLWLRTALPHPSEILSGKEIFFKHL